MFKKIFIYLFLILPSIAFTELKPILTFESEIFRISQEMPVIFTIQNSGTSDEEFAIYDDTSKTFFFELKTSQNEEVELNYNFLVKHDFMNINNSKRTIRLSPYQSFSVKVNISDIFDIRKPGNYYLVGIFSPDGLADKKDGIRTQTYKITVKPPIKVEEETKSISEEYIKKQQELINLPPYEVVRRMLDARYRKDSKEFIIYFDFEKLIAIFPSFMKRYEESQSSSEKSKVIEKFKEYLTTYWGDPILSYSIIRTEIEGDISKVTAEVEYKLRNTSYKLIYYYSLYRTYDNKWLIYSYDVVNTK
ncbi:MAG: hypothetical protein ACP5KI_02590, partial [Brevinematia bacterium]